jgi:DNA-binding NtrC family response regulator
MPKEKVLVVDDDSAIRYTLTEALRGWGYEPLEASTVAAALESFDAEKPSAVLQDVNLPDGSGLDALLEYKKRKPQAIVIMITGNVQSHPLHLNANAL